MAYYKVPQDVEAEDKLLGPFTFKQFLFLIGFAISGFVFFQLARVNFVVAIFLLPIVLFFAVVGFYRPKDQPVETKLIAYINFFFKPHRRVWSRDGIMEHVVIKAPKKIEKQYTDNRTQDEVRSQLKQLAQIVDSRGWASKRATVQEPTISNFLDSDDRLIQASEVTAIYKPIDDVADNDDIFNPSSNPVNQTLSQLSQTADQEARQVLQQNLQKIREGQEPAFDDQTVVNVNPYEPEQPLEARIQHAEQLVQTAIHNQKSASRRTVKTSPKEPTMSSRDNVNPLLQKRLRELEKDSKDLPVSSVAERAQEISIKHDDVAELKIEH